MHSNMIINIAGFNVDFNFENTEFVQGFEGKNGDLPVTKITHKKEISQCHGIQFADASAEHILRRAEAPSELLCANGDWSDCTVYAENYADSEYSLPLAAICSRLALYKTIFIHGSFVEYMGNGIAFTGYSGVGKTTQAQLWEKYLNATPINGDKVFLRLVDDVVFACGSPWKGSSEYCVNKNVPLKAIVVLKQATENKITKLNPIECMKYFMPHVFFPHWDEKCKVEALDAFNDILEKVPVWLLECRPDEEAVLLTKETVFDI